MEVSYQISLLHCFTCTFCLNVLNYHDCRQCLSLPSPSQEEVVLCALFCQPLGHVPSLTIPTSPDPCKLRGSLSVSSHLTSPVQDSKCTHTLTSQGTCTVCTEWVGCTVADLEDYNQRFVFMNLHTCTVPLPTDVHCTIIAIWNI